MLEVITEKNSRGEVCVLLVDSKGQVILVPEKDVRRQSEAAGVRDGDDDAFLAWLRSGGYRPASFEEATKGYRIVKVERE